jgi:hypothetical protein
VGRQGTNLQVVYIKKEARDSYRASFLLTCLPKISILYRMGKKNNLKNRQYRKNMLSYIRSNSSDSANIDLTVRNKKDGGTMITERRHEQRYPVDAEGVILWNGNCIDCRVRNISEAGISVDLPNQLPKDEPVRLEIKGLDVCMGRVHFPLNCNIQLKWFMKNGNGDFHAGAVLDRLSDGEVHQLRNFIQLALLCLRS